MTKSDELIEPEAIEPAQDVEPLGETPPEELQHAQEERLLRVWETPAGWRYWSSVNNTDVGLWYTAMTFFFLLFGGVLALLMRIQLARPNNDFLSAELYNQVFTVHGSVMMFLFARRARSTYTPQASPPSPLSKINISAERSCSSSAASRILRAASR